MKYFPGEQPWGYDKHLSCFFWTYDKLQNTNVYKLTCRKTVEKFTRDTRQTSKKNLLSD